MALSPSLAAGGSSLQGCLCRQLHTLSLVPVALSPSLAAGRFGLLVCFWRQLLSRARVCEWKANSDSFSAFRIVRKKSTILSDSFRIVPLRIFAKFGKMQKMSKFFSESLSWNCRFSDSSNAPRKGCGQGGDESRD